MRTDFYYVFSNYFGCKNLLQDTENFVGNYLSKFCHFFSHKDQSHIPLRERWVIRIYAILWLLGRIAAIAALIGINLPLMWNYCLSLFSILKAGYAVNPYGFIEAILLLIIFSLTEGLGLGLWIRSSWKKTRLLQD